VSLPFNDARALVLKALAPLGTDYVRRFDALLDPAGGRLDLTGGAHRANTGTSIPAFDAPTALYLGSYNGRLASLSELIHEGGHAIHYELMNAGGTPAYMRRGPHSLFEGYAVFNELLLIDEAAKHAATPEARMQALEQFCATISTELFTSAEETTFENSLYESASSAPLLSRDRIDSLYRAAIMPYTSWPMSDVGNSQSWIAKPLLWEDPLYYVNYLYSSLVAVALFDKAHTDPDFGRKFEAMLKRGFDADPATLLATVGITLGDRAMIQRAVGLFSTKVDELQALYAAIPPR
jgi:oligoendopeptidase F